MAEKCGIYWIRNTVNGKFYIGSSSNIDARLKIHRRLLNRGKHGNAHLQMAWNKYGSKSFIFEIIEIANETDLLNIEQWYLDNTRCLDRKYGYNISISAHKNSWSYESREKMSKSMSKPRPSIAGEKSHRFGVKHTQDVIQKIAKAKKEYYLINQHHGCKRVVQITPDGIEITHVSMKAAASTLGVSRESIENAIRGKNKTCRGCTWRVA